MKKVKKVKEVVAVLTYPEPKPPELLRMTKEEAQTLLTFEQLEIVNTILTTNEKELALKIWNEKVSKRENEFIRPIHVLTAGHLLKLLGG